MKRLLVCAALTALLVSCNKKEGAKTTKPEMVHDVFIAEKEFPVAAAFKAVLPDTLKKAVIDTLKFEDTFVVLKAAVAHDENTGIGQVRKISLYKHGNNAVDVSATIGQPVNTGTKEKPMTYNLVSVVFSKEGANKVSETKTVTVDGKGTVTDMK